MSHASFLRLKHRDVSRKALPSTTTLKRDEKLVKVDVQLRYIGRETALDGATEEVVVQRLREFEKSFGFLTNEVIVSEAVNALLEPLANTDAPAAERKAVYESACARLKRFGGVHWAKNFMERHKELTISRRSRPLEQYKVSVCACSERARGVRAPVSPP